MFAYVIDTQIALLRRRNPVFLIGSLLTLLSGNALAANVSLAWDAPATSSPAGYKVRFGQTKGNYPSTIDVGNKLSYMVTGLQPGNTYYFVVTGYNAARTAESGYSNEVRASIAATSPTAPAATPTPKPTVIPLPIATPTPKPTATPKPKPTATPTPKATATPKPTPKASATPKPTPKASATPKATPKASATPTPRPATSPTPSPVPQACDGVPTLDSIPNPQTVHVGQKLTFYVTALDCDGDKVIIRASGKPRRATFVQSYNSTYQKQMGKFVFEPSPAQENRSLVVTFRARDVREQGSLGQSSRPQAISIKVLPALNSTLGVNPQSSAVAGVPISIAQYRENKQNIKVEGRVTMSKTANKEERAQVLSQDVALVDSMSGSLLATAKPSKKTGKFKTLIPADGTVCTIEAHISTTQGKPKAIAGLPNCK